MFKNIGKTMKQNLDEHTFKFKLFCWHVLTYAGLNVNLSSKAIIIFEFQKMAALAQSTNTTLEMQSNIKIKINPICNFQRNMKLSTMNCLFPKIIKIVFEYTFLCLNSNNS